MPAPYGKYSYMEHKNKCSPKILLLPSWLFSMTVPFGFLTFFIGWFEGDPLTLYSDHPSTDRGWLVFVSLCIYYVSKIGINFFYTKDETIRGTKKVHLFWIVPYLLFWVPAGSYWRRAVVNIDKPLELYDVALCLLALGLFGMNIYSDINKNEKRKKEEVKQEEVKPYKVIGKYLNEKQIYEDFASLRGLYHATSLPPNYMFEVAFWFVFIFISWSWEGLWWFCCIFFFLFSRGLWQKRWYEEPIIKEEELMTEQVQLRVPVQGKITF